MLLKAGAAFDVVCPGRRSAGPASEPTKPRKRNPVTATKEEA